jgi:hypothetical protein
MPDIARQRIGSKGVKIRWPVTAVTLWRAIKDRGFPAPHYIGRQRFWWADEVDAWLDEQAKVGAPPIVGASHP